MNRATMRSLTVPGILLGAILVFSLSTESLYRYQLGTLAGIYAVAAIGLGLLLGGWGAFVFLKKDELLGGEEAEEKTGTVASYLRAPVHFEMKLHVS